MATPDIITAFDFSVALNGAPRHMSPFHKWPSFGAHVIAGHSLAVRPLHERKRRKFDLGNKRLASAMRRQIKFAPLLSVS